MERRTNFVLFALALGLRVLYAVVINSQGDFASNAVTSELSYATKIASGTGWIGTPVSPMAPGYPLVLAFLHVLAFKQLWLTMVLQAALGAATVVLFYQLAKTLLSHRFAIFAALWFAVSVHHMQHTALFARDVLVVCLLMLLVWLVVRPLKRMRFALLGALVFTALAHTDPQFLLLLPVFIGLILFKSKHNILNVQYAFLFGAAVVMLSVPWTIRNGIVYHQTVPIALEASMFFRPAKILIHAPETTASEIESRVTYASRTKRIQSNTIEFWRVTRMRAGSVFDASSPADSQQRFEPAWSSRHNLINIVSYGLLLPFFVFGVILAFRGRNRVGIMIFVITAVYFVIRAYLGGNERARLPIEPLVILLAFYTIESLVRNAKHGKQTDDSSRQYEAAS